MPVIASGVLNAYHVEPYWGTSNVSLYVTISVICRWAYIFKTKELVTPVCPYGSGCISEMPLKRRGRGRVRILLRRRRVRIGSAQCLVGALSANAILQSSSCSG